MSIADAPAELLLPTHLDLPETDGKPVENTFEQPQVALLTECLMPVLDRFHPDGSYLIGADTGIYWRISKQPLDGCKSPDWYYVPNVPRLLNGEFRRSYVLWQEYVRPLLVVEVVSGDGSEERDDTPETGKFWVYERAIAAAYYAIWNPAARDLAVFELIRGRYHPVAPTDEGRYRIPPMEIDLGVWEGEFQGTDAVWLRPWDWRGHILPSREEQIEYHQRQRERERERADQERERADRLAAKLRELGLNPDDL